MSGPRVIRLPANARGRDFVLGDIHGSFDLVIKAMEAVGFDRLVDRLISVGDLIDRGVGSDRCLKFLEQPYVHAVRGNHDDMLLQVEPEQAKLLGRVNFNGMRWLQDLPEEQIVAIQDKLRRLPYAIEIAGENDALPTAIVHAEVPREWDWPGLVEALETWDTEDEIFHQVMTSRHRFESGDSTPVEGVERIFSGHTISWGCPKVLGNSVFIDTGAVFRGDGGRMTIVQLQTSLDELERPVAEHPDFPGVLAYASKLQARRSTWRIAVPAA